MDAPDSATHPPAIGSRLAVVRADELLMKNRGHPAQLYKSLILLEATPGIEPGYTVLQTVA
jgi:hypothetical protein